MILRVWQQFLGLLTACFIGFSSPTFCILDSISPKATSNKEIPVATLRNLSIFPINGSRFRLSELIDAKAIVIVMRDWLCPTNREYGYHITLLETKYHKRGIRFIYNYVGRKKMEKWARKDLKTFKFKGAYNIDRKQSFVNALSAQTTEEIFILTPKTRRIIYKGPLNGKFQILNSPLKAKNSYVSNILEDIIISQHKLKTVQKIKAGGCAIARPKIKEKVFYKDVAPIIRNKCSTCHNPSGSSSINYLTYEDVAKRHKMFRYVIKNDLMPPWYLDPNTGPWRNDVSLTIREKAMLLKWLDQGVLKKESVPELLWKIKPNKTMELPDYSIHLPRSVEIPPEGSLSYKRFVISNDFKEDKWIKSVRFFLKPRIVHHATLNIMNSKFQSHEQELFSMSHWNKEHVLIRIPNGMLLSKDHELSDEIGIKLPRKAKLVFELHYESIGRKITDNYSHIHINFHERKPKYQYAALRINFRDINIPPHDSDYKSVQTYKVDKRIWLLSMNSHMHLRGKASEIFVINPKGQKTRIFGVDPFLAKFERTHRLKTPLLVEKGSVIECVNYFDNSTYNSMNPSASANVTYGFFIEDEMSICLLLSMISNE